MSLPSDAVRRRSTVAGLIATLLLSACGGGATKSVAPVDPSASTTLATLTVSPSALTIVAGDTFRLTFAGKNAAGAAVSLSGRTLTWVTTPSTNGDFSISSGLAISTTPGQYRVRLAYDTAKADLDLTVLPGTPDPTLSSLAAAWSTTTAGAIDLAVTVRNQRGIKMSSAVAADVAFQGGAGTMGATSCTAGVCTAQYLPPAAPTTESLRASVRGTAISTRLALTVRSALTFSAVTVGASHSCALVPTGEAYCWGSNARGQLGDSSTVSSASPVPVWGGLRYRAIAAGDNHTCATTIAGVTSCWGAGNHLQLGGSTTVDRTVPTPISDVTDLVSLVAGTSDSCGLTAVGAAYCWGDDWTQLPIASGAAHLAISARGDLSCGLRPGGVASCWTGTGRVGAATSVISPALSSIANTATGGCGLTAANALWCWNMADRVLPANQVTATQTYPSLAFVRIFAGVDSFCGATADNRIACWGTSRGQFGDFAVLTGDFIPAGTTASTVLANTIAANGAHMCGLTAAGVAMCWGSNSSGQLGDRTTTTRTAPTAVNTTTSVQYR